ncbi:DUF6884 domain-containing protein [Haladaptatus sp. T7]|uniref:DUF6884 domain-containing protein n=1 Tax=Haladaptatus sp. T7 TaxID=2029368 RepID=UPI0021A2538D|nr:DUF6884 domain-containing protein [Haladaptatus sp. T7]GKZ16079.1 hypothetical protein HAL_39600 [Haladaptatus sp. T7]
MTRTIGLVSCTKSKSDEPAQPRDLYEPSTLFRKASDYCERTYDEWYILSAKYGLLDPEGPPIEPYDETLTNASIATRRTWADNVVKELADRGFLCDDTHLYIHAGKAYYGELLPRLEGESVSISLPTEGLMIGETLAWYNKRQ